VTCLVPLYNKIEGYGVTITSLEEVFLRVGGDHELDSVSKEKEVWLIKKRES
jgi:hypothetical protein